MVILSFWLSARCRRSLLLFLTGLFVCTIVLSSGASASGQIFSLGNSTSSVSSKLPPTNVTRYGALEVAWVKSPLTRNNLFQIASPTVIDRSAVTAKDLPVEVRAQNIEELIRLEILRFRKGTADQLFPRFDKPSHRSDIKATGTTNKASSSAEVIISKLKNLTVLQFANVDKYRPLTIATVTASDTEFYSETTQKVAQEWKNPLQAEIAEAERLFSPKVLRQRIQQGACIILGILVSIGALTFFHRLLGKHQKALKLKADAKSEASELKQTAPPLETEASTTKPLLHEHWQLAHLLNQQFTLNQRRETYKSIQWLLLWLTVLVCYLGTYFLTTRIPGLMRWSNRLLIEPLSLIVIWFIISAAIRLSSALIHRSVNAWKDNAYLTFGDAQRKAFRSQTISGALQGLVAFIFISLGILLSLIQLGLPVSSVLAGSALIGLALSLGAQNIVKDMVNGCLILFEDQFAVGDVITANGESGLVEKLNLRLTQLRNADGELISIPNNTITLVKNLTSSWSRVNMGIKVAYDTDLDQAITLINTTATDMSKSSEWQSLILEPPQVLGVDDFGDNSITIRLLIRTQPSQQWLVGREFRRLIKQAFDHQGISMPFPQRSVWFKNPMPTLPPEEQNDSIQK